MVDMGVLIGSFRRFGLFGPPYEVLGPGSADEAAKPKLRIRLLETGEETEYGVEYILADPVED